MKITFRYIGPEVEDGSMEVSEVVEALEGLSGAYLKIAHRIDAPEDIRQLKVLAIDKGSFWVTLAAGAQILSQQGDFGTVVDAGKFVFETLRDIIAARLHTKGKDFKVEVKGDGNLVLINGDNSPLIIGSRAFEIFKSRAIEKDLGKIADPLQADRINAVELVGHPENEKPIEAKILSSERHLFELGELTLNKIELDLIVRLISLNKKRNKGVMETGDGHSVPYRYVGKDPELFHSVFALKGQVRVSGIAEIGVADEAPKIVRFDVSFAEPAKQQAELPLSEP